MWCVCIRNFFFFFFLNKNTIFFFLVFFHFLPSMPGLCSTPACTSAVLDQYKRWWRRYQTFFYETSTEGHTGSCCFSAIHVATVNPEDFQIKSWGGWVCVLVQEVSAIPQPAPTPPPPLSGHLHTLAKSGISESRLEVMKRVSSGPGPGP